jgi:cyclophilin family peptidyl-prolyl cis-trans isomerase
MRGPALLLGVALSLALGACAAEPTPSPKPSCPTAAPTSIEAQSILQDAGHATVIVSGGATGSFEMELFGDAAPIATANFVNLARCGFYDGIWFHRILAGFVVQAGDPNTKGQGGDFDGLGQGTPGYRFAIEPPADGLGYGPYSVSMANAAPDVPDSNGSQFFIALADLNSGLARNYTVFGQITAGTEVIDQIAAVPVSNPRFGVPLQLVTIDSIAITTEPPED